MPHLANWNRPPVRRAWWCSAAFAPAWHVKLDASRIIVLIVANTTFSFSASVANRSPDIERSVK